MALLNGDIPAANLLLGYNYTLTGKVIRGEQLGRKMGFPTANIDTFDRHKLVPGDGVYAVLVTTAGERFKGMLNIGVRPTVNHNADHKTVEVHIFDFNEDIYNQEITLSFIGKIRDEQKFASIDQLRNQLINDRISALNVLSEV